MAFDRLKRLFGGDANKKKPAPLPVRYDDEPAEKAPAVQKKSARRAAKKPARKPHRSYVKVQGGSRTGKARKLVRSDASPYTIRPGLEKENIQLMEKLIRKSPDSYRTDKLTLMEIADRILEKEIQMPRPPGLRAHAVFEMFTRDGNRVRSGVKTVCHEWRGAVKGGIPVLTTVNAIHGHRLQVDARKYILENPPEGKRRNFRTTPANLCNNPLCVNPKHIEMQGKDPALITGENHGRAKFSDKDIQRWVREYNAGATAKELSKKYDVVMTYVEQIMRKEKRTEATEGMTIRGRFGSR